MEVVAIGVVLAYIFIKLWRFVLWLVMIGAVALLIYLQSLT